MPKGGARVGAGRKPKSNILAMPGAGVPTGPVTVPDPPEDMVAADEAAKARMLAAGLPVDIQWASDVWRAYAPAAAENGTLAPGATLIGFRVLVDVDVKCRRMEARIDAEGWLVESELMGPKAHPLWARFEKLMLRREQMMRAYGLIANGKPVVRAAPAGQADPWADRARRKA